MKLKILGHEYTAILKPCRFIEGSHGYINQNTLMIEVDSMIPKSAQEEVLLHEIIEALNYRLELKLEHNQITGLSEGLYQVLKDAEFLNVVFCIDKEEG